MCRCSIRVRFKKNHYKREDTLELTYKRQDSYYERSTANKIIIVLCKLVNSFLTILRVFFNKEDTNKVRNYDLLFIKKKDIAISLKI